MRFAASGSERLPRVDDHPFVREGDLSEDVGLR